MQHAIKDAPTPKPPIPARRLRILVLGLVRRQQQLVRTACASLPGVDLRFADCAVRRPLQDFPRVDLCIATRFVSHKWHFKAVRALGPKRLQYAPGGLGALIGAITDAARGGV